MFKKIEEKAMLVVRVLVIAMVVYVGYMLVGYFTLQHEAKELLEKTEMYTEMIESGAFDENSDVAKAMLKEMNQHYENITVVEDAIFND